MTVARFRACVFSTCLIGLAGLYGCGGREALVSLDLTGYNHTERSIGSFSVSIPNGSGTGAGFLGAGEGGGGFTCCLSVPRIWHAGMTVTVSRRALVDGVPDEVSTSVAVPKYDSTGASFFSVHFLRNGGVKVFVTRYGLYHRNYPLQGEEAKLRPGVAIDHGIQGAAMPP